MAFKVLTKEQTALLTENEKEQYEKELAAYNARAAFVERIKILEGAQIPSYEPKLQNISMIDEIPEKAFANPEYTVTLCEPITKPEPNFSMPEFAETVSVILPEYSKIAKVEVNHIKKAEASKPELPEIAKVHSEIKPYDKAETTQPELPEIMKISSSVKPFKKAERTQPILPGVGGINMERVLSDKKLTSFPTPENIEFTLPQPLTVMKPDIVADRNKAKGVKAVLPELSNSKPVKVEFSRPDIPSAQLPVISKPKVAVCGFEPVGDTAPDLSALKKPKPNLKGFESIKTVKPIQAVLPELSEIKPMNVEIRKPEISNTRLPVISKPKVAVSNFSPIEESAPPLPVTGRVQANIRVLEIQEYEKPELPIVEKAGAFDKIFKPVEISKPDITVAEISIIDVKPFVRVDSRAADLPDKITISIPDAYECLKELFSPVKKNPEAMEEADL